MRRKDKARADEPVKEDPEEQVVDEFMQGGLRADRLDDLCEALRLRIRAMKAEIASRPESPARDDLEKRVKEARHQLAVLRQEQAISQFVEESVRATLHNDAVRPEAIEEEDW